MARELNSDKSAGSLAASPKSEIPPLVDQDKDARRNVIPSETSLRSSSRNASSTMKGETRERSAVEQVYSGSYNQFDDQVYRGAGSSSYKGSQSDDSFYYLPAYSHYPAGAYLCVDGYQPYCSSSGYVQNSSAYGGSEYMPHYYWNTTQFSDATHGTAAVRGQAKLSLSSDMLANSKTSDDPMKNYKFLDNKTSTLSQTTKLQHYTASPKYYESLLRDQSLRNLHQLGSSYLSTDDLQKFQSYGKWSSCTGSKQGNYFTHDALNYERANAGMWSGTYRSTSSKKPTMHGESEAKSDLTRGPRRLCKNIPLGSSAGVEQMEPSTDSLQYNSKDFPIEYDNAKFYVIKSYNEDNIYKSIKYDVWSSTPDGNKKLDAAFRDKMAKTSEAGKECPIFLFFSVNGSGQFVGVAEMVGPVDFDNNLDFWELNKWNGFFPVKWHIVKDIPNAMLRHIILENNDNRPVTFTRDTQEVGLTQGIEMLKIFRAFDEETSLLDDFGFYKLREQTLEGKRNTAPQTDTSRNLDTPKLKQEIKRIIDGDTGASSDLADSTSSLINLAKNLSLNSNNL